MTSFPSNFFKGWHIGTRIFLLKSRVCDLRREMYVAEHETSTYYYWFLNHVLRNCSHKEPTLTPWDNRPSTEKVHYFSNLCVFPKEWSCFWWHVNKRNWFKTQNSNYINKILSERVLDLGKHVLADISMRIDTAWNLIIFVLHFCNVLFHKRGPRRLQASGTLLKPTVDFEIENG